MSFVGYFAHLVSLKVCEWHTVTSLRCTGVKVEKDAGTSSGRIYYNAVHENIFSAMLGDSYALFHIKSIR